MGQVGTSSRLGNVSGALLLGGYSDALGCKFATFEIGGESLALRLARTLSGLFEEVILAGGEPPEDVPGRRVADPPGPPGPLRGVVGALDAARTERVLVLAADLAMVGPSILLGLTAWPISDVVVPRTSLRVHYGCAIYRREAALSVARALLDRGESSPRGLVDQLDAQFLEGDDLAAMDPSGRALEKIRGPDSIARVEGLWREGQS